MNEGMTMVTKTEQTVSINDVTYKLSDLTEQARAQLNNLRMTDHQIEHLQNQLAIAKTARISYGRALDKALPKAPKATIQ